MHQVFSWEVVAGNNQVNTTERIVPLFRIKKNAATPVAQSNFLTERALQGLVEGNLDTIFKCRFVASEFPTGSQHGGRIDTLALSEDDNPVIIEYKKVESSELVNQSLFYLAWLDDHRGDFAQVAQRKLGSKVKIDWTEIRVICIAPNYRKYDLHAVKVMGRSIELWSYRRFENDTFYLEEVYPAGDTSAELDGKNPVMVAAGKKAAVTRASATWSFEQHLVGKPPAIRELARAVQDFMRGLSATIEEAPKKQYIAYRTAQNIVTVELQKQKVYLYVKLDPTVHNGPRGISRDVSAIGHFGTGDLEITLRNLDDFEAAKPWLVKAYEALGG